MSLALSAILDRVLQECKLAKAAAYIAGGPGELALVALAQRSATLLRQLHLSYPRVLGTINMTAALSYALPSDFYEYIPDTAFMQSNLQPVEWPTPDDVWNQLKIGAVQMGPMLRVRPFAGQLAVLNPVNGGVLQFEYLSKLPIAATATPTVPSKQYFTVDTDVWLLDDELIVMDLVWRHKQVSGLPWETAFQDFNAYKDNLIARSQGARTLVPGENVPMPAEWPYTRQWV